MLAHYISDLHLEKHFSRATNILLGGGNALFIAGDLGTPCRPEFKGFLYRASDVYKNVFYVAGNHEYEKARCPVEMKDIDNEIDEIAEQRENIFVLSKGRSYTLGKYTIIGSTLWSLVNVPTWRNQERGARHIEEVIALRALIENSKAPIVVMTHYLPSLSLISPYYARRFNNLSYWASSSDDLIKKPVTTWFAGHSHTIYDGFLYDVHILINAKGRGVKKVML